MKSNKFEVGQVIFVLLQEKMKVVAVQVVEEINRKTIDGESTSYLIKNRPDDKDYVPLHAVKGEAFSDLEEIKSLMIKNATSHIDQIINAVSTKASIFDIGDALSDNIERTGEDDFVVLEDGTRARVRI
tara:strand:+ start:110 stop:496 length:387 start_codon:yes stop_codon:yes gene_type:complete